MSNITSTILERITNKNKLNTDDYYLVKDRIEIRRDYTGYFLTHYEKQAGGMFDPASTVFRKVWQRIPRASDEDAYNQWVNLRTWNRNNRGNRINEYLVVSNNNLHLGNVLIYSLGEMKQYFNNVDTPDVSYQNFKRRNKLHQQVKEHSENETMKNEDSGIDESTVPTLQYLARKTILQNPNLEKYVKDIKDDANIDVFKIHKKYTGWQQNAGKSKKRRKMKKQRKSKKQRN